MPSHRNLAYQLGIAVGSVARAYTLLVESGVLSSTVGRGTIVRSAQSTNHLKLATDYSRIDMRLIVPPPITSPALLTKISQAMDIGRDRSLAPESMARYPSETGAVEHRQAASSWCKAHGVNATPESVLITNGGQEALLNVLLALNQHDTPILCEELSLASLKNLVSFLGVSFRGVEIDDEGIVPESLETVAGRSGARVLVTMPELQVPTAARVTSERRSAVAKIAEALDIVVVEYNAYAMFLDERLDDFSNYCPERSVTIQSFSGVTMPGLRCCIVNAPPRLIPRIAAARYATVTATSSLVSATAKTWIETGIAARILTAHRKELKARHVVLSEVLPEVAARTPVGSPFIWMPLSGRRANDFILEASALGVEVLSADRFYFGGSEPPNAIRAAISNPVSHDLLRHGLVTLRDLQDL